MLLQPHRYTYPRYLRLNYPVRYITNPFSRKTVASDSNELMKYAKDPSQFAEYAKLRN